jgi:hypothetical protein
MIGFMAFLASETFAQTVTIDLDDQKAAEFGLDTQSLEDSINQQINDQLKTDTPDVYMTQFAEASALALKGMGVDYASNPKIFSIGGTLGTGVAGIPWTVTRGTSELPEGGFAFMASLHGGLNVGALTPGDDLLDHLTVYVNGLAFQPPSERSFSASMYNFGVHAQLKLFGPVRGTIVEWGGLDVTGGYERSFYELTLSQPLPLSQQVEDATVTWDASGDYSITSTADTVPIELSTNLRVFVVSVYGGAAVDLRAATANASVGMDGPVDAERDGETTTLGTAAVSVTGDGVAENMLIRGFGGVQLNAGPAKIYAHLNVASQDRYGGFVGVRVSM